MVTPHPFVSLKLFTDRAHAVMVLRTADIAAINIEQVDHEPQPLPAAEFQSLRQVSAEDGITACLPSALEQGGEVAVAYCLAQVKHGGKGLQGVGRRRGNAEVTGRGGDQESECESCEA